MGWLNDPDDRAVLIFRPGKEVEIVGASEASLPMPTSMNTETYRVKDLFDLLVL